MESPRGCWFTVFALNAFALVALIYQFETGTFVLGAVFVALLFSLPALLGLWQRTNGFRHKK